MALLEACCNRDVATGMRARDDLYPTPELLGDSPARLCFLVLLLILFTVHNFSVFPSVHTSIIYSCFSTPCEYTRIRIRRAF